MKKCSQACKTGNEWTSKVIVENLGLIFVFSSV